MISTHILNTRPAHQSHHLTHLIQKAGGTVFELPLFDIKPISFEPIKIDDFDVIIFLSANAVNRFFAINDKKLARSKIITIGPATQHALEKLGFNSVYSPEFFSSEGIAVMPMLQKISGQSIAIISGSNPKPLLQQVLAERGARIKTIFCYARQPVIHHMEVAFPVLKKNKISVVICTSGESFSHLLKLFEHPTHRKWLLKRTLCVVNNEMKEDAITIGFHSVIQTENATDEAIVRAICSQVV